MRAMDLKRTRTTMLLAYIFVPLTANTVTIIFSIRVKLSEIVGSLISPGISRHMLESSAGGGGIEALLTILYYIIPFGAIFSCTIVYLLPALRLAGDMAGDLTTDPSTSVRARRRVLDAPFAVSVMSAVGWILAFAGEWVSLAVSYHGPSASGLVSSVVSAAVSFVASGLLCFVVCYYPLEILSRSWIIKAFFPENDLSSSIGSFNPSLGVKFAVFFFAVAVFPLCFLCLLFFSRFMAIGDDQLAHGGWIALTFLAVGAWLTAVFAASFRDPLEALRRAASRIGEGDYAIEVPVRSTDEIGILSESLNAAAKGLRERELMRESFGRAVDPAVRDYILSANSRLGGETRRVAVLFADIRGFTTLSESLPPKDLVATLNRFLERASAIVAAEGGFVNKFLGDAVLAVFGAPLPLPSPARSAISAASTLSRSIGGLADELRAAGLPSIEIGIGIHEGPAVCGNIGSSTRMEYTVIGDAVNAGSRLEGAAKAFRTRAVCSMEALAEAGDPQPRTRALGLLALKGKRQPILAFELLDAYDDDTMARRAGSSEAFDEATALLRSGSFAEAAEHYKKVAAADPGDGPAATLAAYATKLAKTHDLAAWNGVIRLASK